MGLHDRTAHLLTVVGLFFLSLVGSVLSVGYAVTTTEGMLLGYNTCTMPPVPLPLSPLFMCFSLFCCFVRVPESAQPLVLPCFPRPPLFLSKFARESIVFSPPDSSPSTYLFVACPSLILSLQISFCHSSCPAFSLPFSPSFPSPGFSDGERVAGCALRDAPRGRAAL